MGRGGKGNRCPHVTEQVLMLEHDSTFQVLEDPDSDDDEQVEDAVWLDDPDKDLMKSSDPLSPCCLLTCTSRGRSCLVTMVQSMNDDQKQREDHLEPPPAAVYATPCSARRIWRRTKPHCNGYSPCLDECGRHAQEPKAPMSPLNTNDAESPEDVNEEVIEWSDDIDKTPAVIWEKVEDDDDAVRKPTIDAFGVRGEVTFPADEALSAETPKVLSKDCWVQTELKREEVGVQTEKSTEYVDELEPIFHDCLEEWEIKFETMIVCDSLEAYEELMYGIENDEYNTDENLISSMRDPRNYPDGNLCVLEGEAYDEVHVAQSMEEPMQRIEVALDSGAGEHVASKNVAPAYAISESAGSRAGQHFVAAGGARIQNEGQFTLRLRTGGLGRHEGKDINSTFQVAKVTRPLWSVGRICDEGFDVKFSKESAVVQSKDGKEVCKFQRKGGLYLAELHLKPEPKPFTRLGT